MTKPKTEEALHQRVLDILERCFPKVDTMVCQTTDKRSYTATLETSELADIVWFPSMGGYSARVLGHLNVLQFEPVTEALRLLDGGIERPIDRALAEVIGKYPCAIVNGELIRLHGFMSLSPDVLDPTRYELLFHSTSPCAVRIPPENHAAINRALAILNEAP